MANNLEPKNSTVMPSSEAGTSIPSLGNVSTALPSSEAGTSIPSLGNVSTALPSSAGNTTFICSPINSSIPLAVAFSGDASLPSAPAQKANKLSTPAKTSSAMWQEKIDNFFCHTDTAAHTKALIDFMRQIHLGQYTLELIEQGYDDLNFMSTLSREDLQGVATLVNMRPGHAAKFVVSMTRAVNAKSSTSPTVTEEVTQEVTQKPASAASASSSSDSAYVVCIVDRSGSMRSMGQAVKTGFNTFIQEQKAVPGECLATVVRFDSEVEIIHHGVDLSDVTPATADTFRPRGRTALYDGIGETIAMVQRKISNMPSKPEKVMVMVLTDGEENGSCKYSHAEIMKTIVYCEKKLKWTFVFIGANQDAIATGTRIGFSANNCMSYSSNPTYQHAAWSNVSANMCRQRAGGSANWTDLERSSSVSAEQSEQLLWGLEQMKKQKQMESKRKKHQKPAANARHARFRCAPHDPLDPTTKR